MAELTPSLNDMTSVADLDVDSLVRCASYLNLQDLSNMAMTCRFFKTAAYCDSIWLRLFREKWPKQMLQQYPLGIQVREAYLTRHTAVLQFNFVDPLVADFYTDARPFSHVLLGKNSIFFSQGSLIHILDIDNFINGKDGLVALRDHNARITCMRIFSLNEASFIRNKTQSDDNILITSSCDHSIRLWRKGSCFRCFKGHSGPVTTLSDKLLGDNGSKVLASGGEDGTVRLWSLSSTGKRGQHALNATLYGHEKPVKLISVTGYKTSLFISVAADSKIRVWDSTVASTSRMSSCVGMASVHGAPVGIRCFESMVYIAAGSFVNAIDLRTMKKAFTAAIEPQLNSFEMLPSNSLVCTGGTNRALLWDIRKSKEGLKPLPMAELEGHNGPVTHVHMDPYKIVTGGTNDFYIHVWKVETGSLSNSLICCGSELSNASTGCDAMAVDGNRIATTTFGENGLVRFRDFTDATCSVSSSQEAGASKFWNSQYSDSDSDM